MPLFAHCPRPAQFFNVTTLTNSGQHTQDNLSLCGTHHCPNTAADSGHPTTWYSTAAHQLRPPLAGELIEPTALQLISRSTTGFSCVPPQHMDAVKLQECARCTKSLICSHSDSKKTWVSLYVTQLRDARQATHCRSTWPAVTCNDAAHRCAGGSATTAALT